MSISVVCPVYKAELFISKCIDSILKQTYTDWELILIDDGSPDSSGNICDEFAKKDVRIKVIHQQNSGVSAARQAGLDAATGDYVIHADSDDWFEPTMLEELYLKAKEDDADMVICDFYVDRDGKSERRKQQPSALFAATVLKEMFENLMGCCWNKLIRRDTIIKCSAKFPLGVNYCEDVCFNVQLLICDIKISYLNKAFYHYVQYKTSLTNDFNERTLESCKRYVDFLCTLLASDSYPVVKSKEMVKRNVYNNKVLSRYEILTLYPEIRTVTDPSFLNIVIYRLAFCGYYKLADFIVKFRSNLVKLKFRRDNYKIYN